jgi:uncharacterized membrane protein
MTALFIFLLLLAAAFFFGQRARPGTESDLRMRVEFLERRVADLQAAVDALRPTLRERTRPVTPPPTPAPPSPPKPALAPTPTAAPKPHVQTAPPAPPFELPKISAADLMGAKALAIAGGVVTLLGVVFFFVLAVNRGWIGPELRVACGGIASAIVFSAGLWLQRRYETTYSALAAVGAGIAGAYATLLASVALYDLVSKPVALVVAAGIASVGVAVSLAWSEELVAGFGLIGAMAVPATLVLQGGLQQIGTAFVAVVFAATAIVAVRERWWTMLKVAALVSVPQTLAQIAEANAPGAGIVALAAAFWLLYLGAGIAYQLRLGPQLASSPASFLTGSAVFAGIAAMTLYPYDEQGYAVLVVASVYVLVAAVLFRSRRELSGVVAALGLGLAAVGLAETLSGSPLTYAWAAEAAVLVWIGARVRDARYQLLSLGYLGLAVIHALAVEASLDHLFRAMRHPASGALALVAIAIASTVFARVKRNKGGEESATGILRVLNPVLHGLRAKETVVNTVMLALGATATAYAVSLGILELFQAVWQPPDVRAAFEWGHLAVTSVWSIAGLFAVLVALRRRSQAALALSLGWLLLVVVKVVAFDPHYALGLLVVGSAVLLAGLARELAHPKELTGEGTAALVLSLGLLIGGLVVLVPNDGLALVSLGALYVALAASLFARRDLSTLLWALGLATVAVGEALLLSGVWLVLAYTATAAALALLSVRARERRLLAPSLVYLASGAFLALFLEATPANLVMARPHPGAGIPSLLLVIGATLALAWAARDRVEALWVAVGLSVYTASLAILEAAQWLSPEGVHTDFQRGQTAVSAFWGLLALASLYIGLRQRRGLLRAVGFVLFAISLGKIFLFDLPSLSSAQRALSFLAVGAVLLLGGFFYQRLSAQFDGKEAI